MENLTMQELLSGDSLAKIKEKDTDEWDVLVQAAGNLSSNPAYLEVYRDTMSKIVELMVSASTPTDKLDSLRAGVQVLEYFSTQLTLLSRGEIKRSKKGRDREEDNK